MKNIHKTGIAFLAFSLCLGVGLSLVSQHKKAAKVEAYDVLTVPNLINDFYSVAESQRQAWVMDDDPDNGASSTYSVYSTSINSSLDGFRNGGIFSIDPETTSPSNYLRVHTSSATKKFYAQYVPFHADVYVPAYTKGVYTFTFTLDVNRAAGGGNADYSIELFSFGSTRLTPTTWFYHQNDFTTSTGRGYSKYRLAGDTRGASPSAEGIEITETFENITSSTLTVQAHFGVFCYVESSGTEGNYSGKVTVTRLTREITNAVAVVNDKNYYEIGAAISAYNSQDASVMTLCQDLTVSGARTFSSAGGRINLNRCVLDMGNSHIAFTANTDIYGTSNTGSKITSSSNYAVLAINTAAIVSLNSNLIIESTYNNLDSGRAVLLGDADAKLLVGPYAKINSAKNGVQIDNGYLYLAGEINPGTGRNAIIVGTSDAAKKYIFIYGAYAKANKISVGNTAKTYISASFNSSPYSNNQDVALYYDTDPALNSTVVRDVNDSNYSKFTLVSNDYTLSKSGTNLIAVYKSFSVSYNLTNCTQTGGSATASRQANLTFTITADSSCWMPASITVTIGGTTMTQGTQYTYNSNTGAVVVYSQYITGYVSISATATMYYTIQFQDKDGNTVADTIQVAKNGAFTLPYPTIHPDYYSNCMWMYNQDLSGGGVGAGHVVYANQGNKTYYANYSQTDEDRADQFRGVELHFDVDIIPVTDESNTGACLGSNGLYAKAKTKYNSFTSNVKQLFCTLAKYADARARFNAWANANGERLDLNTYQLVQAKPATTLINEVVNGETNAALIVVFVSVISVITLTGFIMIRRKRSK